MAKNQPAMQETPEMWVQSLGWEDPLEEEMATHSSILAWESLGQRSLEGHNSWGHEEPDTTEQLSMQDCGIRELASSCQLPQ